MEQLNDYLRALLATCSNELHLEPNRNPYLVSDSGTTNVSPTPLVGTTISTMVFPLIPDDVKRVLPNSPEVQFMHNEHFGSFKFNVRKSPAGFNVTIVPILRSEIDEPKAGSVPGVGSQPVNTVVNMSVAAPHADPLAEPNVLDIPEFERPSPREAEPAIVLPKVEVASTHDPEFATGFSDGAIHEPPMRPADRMPVPQVPAPQFTVPAPAPFVEAPAPVFSPAPAPKPTAASTSETFGPTRSAAGKERIEALLKRLVEIGASDLHLSVGVPPMVRLDGKMRVLEGGGEAITPESARELLMSIIPERNFEEFERRNDTDFAHDIPGVGRFRSNIFMDRKGMGGAFRAIPCKILTAEQLGLSKAVLELCNLHKGLVLVTGPTGSGKSTTLCAMVDHINKTRDDHIITIEDPIEFVHDNQKCLVNQREVHSHTDSFKDALRAALREDPDIVLVGELRDLETMAIAIETAETGHLVFGTLHTTTAASTVDRIIDQFPADRQAQIRVMLSESLKGVISQILLPKKNGGRVAALEVLIVTPAISNLIREGKTFQIPSAMQTGKSVGMVMLNDALFEHVQSGAVEPREAYNKAVDKTGFEVMLKRAGIQI